jgi:Ca-activated chloride channel family protein
MTGFEFAALKWIHLVWLAPAVGLLTWYGLWRRSRGVAVFGLDERRAAEWRAAVRRRRVTRAALIAMSLIALTGAALQPRANPEKQKIKSAARDLVICLDVSRSMLADDLSPSRLERAKLELSRLADQLAGDRVGLVVFAGDAVVLCPLTENYSYFKTIVSNISTESVSQGGTKIGDALRKGIIDVLGLRPSEAIDEKDPQAGETVMEVEAKGAKETFADILLITDGEDHDSYPEYAARRAAGLNLGVYCVGLGSEAGTQIMVRGEDGQKLPLMYKGEPVVSRLDSNLLRELAIAGPRGAYLPVGTKNFDLVEFYQNVLVAQAPRREIDVETVTWTEVFQPVLLLGLGLFTLGLLVPERPSRFGIGVNA